MNKAPAKIDQAEISQNILANDRFFKVFHHLTKVGISDMVVINCD